MVTKVSSNVNAIESAVKGCFEIQYPVASDHRGNFVKVFNTTLFTDLGFETEFPETFYSVSGARVLRGMHFQRPPADHAKLVYCTSGSILDVALDLRVGSPSYGSYASFELHAETHTAVYLPRGVAHGFYVLDGPATMVYHVSTEYSPADDAGISWDSFGFPWPDTDPILSKRDSAFEAFGEFKTPFSYSLSEETE